MSDNKEINKDELEKVDGGIYTPYVIFTYILTYKKPTGEEGTYKIMIRHYNEPTAHMEAYEQATKYCNDRGYTYISLEKE